MSARTGHLFAWAIAMALAAGCGTPGDSGAPGQTGDDSPTAAGRTMAESLTVDGTERTYRLRLPGTVGDEPAALVLMLHGGFGDGAQAEESYGWNEVADREGVLVAYPDGLNRSWAVSETCCGRSAADGVDDVGFISAVVDAVATQHPVDRSRVFAVGISNGGMLAYRLACDTDLLAAVGAASATLLGECDSPAPLSVLHIHGSTDEAVPVGGGPPSEDNRRLDRPWVDIDGPGVADLMAHWRVVADCETPTVTGDGDLTRSSALCPGGLAVDSIIIDGAGHQWPGADPKPAVQRLLGLDEPSSALDATETFWTFFSDHPGARP